MYLRHWCLILQPVSSFVVEKTYFTAEEGYDWVKELLLNLGFKEQRKSHKSDFVLLFLVNKKIDMDHFWMPVGFICVKWSDMEIALDKHDIHLAEKKYALPRRHVNALVIKEPDG